MARNARKHIDRVTSLTLTEALIAHRVMQQPESEGQLRTLISEAERVGLPPARMQALATSLGLHPAAEHVECDVCRSFATYVPRTGDEKQRAV